jgi:U4/U6.U5 tri-snRNP-associated protein 2
MRGTLRNIWYLTSATGEFARPSRRLFLVFFVIMSSDAGDQPSPAKKVKFNPHIETSGNKTTSNNGAGDAGKNGDVPSAAAVVKKSNASDDRSHSCPYLDTINRTVLDFDFEKLCSVSLSKINVYACLVCGKYFQGRGIGTHAYIHSVAVSHHVFLNLSSLKFYCLPDNYEVIDSSLSDITYVLRPTFSRQEIRAMDVAGKKQVIAFDGTAYQPGIVGLNNIKANDYCNVILHALSHISPVRDYFLLEDNYISKLKEKRAASDPLFDLVIRFGELIRKLWNPRNFKAHVSPHEMLQSVVLCSKKRFQITEQEDPINFLSWILNSLHAGLSGSKKANSSIIYRSIRGSMRIFSRKMIPVSKSIDEKLQLMLTPEYRESASESQFLYLTLDLPAPPLFKDELQANIIPQVPLQTLLSKFNGSNEKEYTAYDHSELKRFQITSLPPYLILYIRRFTKNTFFQEKNPTIVNFDVKDVDMSDMLIQPESGEKPKAVYDLIANIVHDGPAKREKEKDSGSYRVHILHRASGKWYEMQDLHVTEILPQMIPLSESYIQVWRRQTQD